MHKHSKRAKFANSVPCEASLHNIYVYVEIYFQEEHTLIIVDRQCKVLVGLALVVRLSAVIIAN